ncbi:hypothetical protein EU78_06300 [Mycolicibacterium rufum]|nr:hypothetical protein EU78_06300 [Mycolicibacterium rufum]
MLHDMSQFVGDQATTLVRGGCELATPEDNVPSDGVGARANGDRGLSGSIVSTDSYMAEVASESRLEESTGRGIKAPARPAKHVVNECRRGATADGRSCLLGTQHVFFAATLATYLRRRRGRHPHHAVGCAIGFCLKRIVDVADHEFGLNDERTGPWR